MLTFGLAEGDIHTTPEPVLKQTKWSERGNVGARRGGGKMLNKTGERKNEENRQFGVGWRLWSC